MGFNDRLSEAHAQHTAMSKGAKREDVLRLIAEGKRPATQEENERPVGEDGKPLEKLQLAPERDILRGGGMSMARLWPWTRSYRASAKELTAVREGLAQMPPPEQAMWCLGKDGKPGLIAVVFTVGYPELHPVIMNMLKNHEINEVKRGDMAKAVIDLKPGVEVIREMLKMVKHSELHSYSL